MTRPYILRTEPTDSGESGYRPPSREWLKSKRVKRLNFAHLLDAEMEKTAFMARIESLGGTIRSGGWCGRLKRGEMAVETRGLSFSYRGSGGASALKSVDFDVKRGEFVVIMGPSGAGKSTLANCLNGLVPRFIRGEREGVVLVNGVEAGRSPVNRMAGEIGLVFQDFEAQLFSTNVRLEVAFGPENFGVPRAEIAERVERVLRMVDLQGKVAN